MILCINPHCLRPQNAQMILRCISEINSTVHSHFSPASPSVPPTIVQNLRNRKQIKSSDTTQIHSSKTQTNTSSTKFATFKYTGISSIILILLKFSSQEIHKHLSSQPNQPVVASMPNQVKTANSEEKHNSSEQLKNDLNRQAPPRTENTPPVIPPGWKSFRGEVQNYSYREVIN